VTMLNEPSSSVAAPAKPPMVSVVIPSYNRSRMLLRAIQSVCMQTFADFELIVVDDGSTDNTSSVAEALADPRIRLVRNPIRQGAPRSRNRGIEVALGEWVAFLDSDDEWLPTRLELQLQRLQEVGAGSAAVGYCLLQVQDHIRGEVSQTNRALPEGEVLDDLLRGRRPPTASAFMVRRSALLDVEGFDQEMPSGHDIDLWLRLAERGYRFFAVNQALVIWHRHAGPRVSGDPDALLRGFLRFKRRWGPVMRRRIGRRAYCRWIRRRSRHLRQVLWSRCQAEIPAGNALGALRCALGMCLPVACSIAATACLSCARLWRTMRGH
jgi:glycosyltransferase involved in cell wall biosynthesis